MTRAFIAPATKSTQTASGQRYIAEKRLLSEADKSRESDLEFIHLRHKHSAVESAISALSVHGLDKCPDHSIDGFKRYVALVVAARNIPRTALLS